MRLFIRCSQLFNPDVSKRNRVIVARESEEPSLTIFAGMWRVGHEIRHG